VRIHFGPFVLDLDISAGRTADPHRAQSVRSPRDARNERPKVLSKLELLQRLWPDTFVAEANLSNIVAESREALGDNRGPNVRRPRV